MPKRVQLRRTRGWRMPPGAVKVDRSTLWGNPFGWQTGHLPDHGCRRLAVHAYRELLVRGIVSGGTRERATMLDRRAAILANMSKLRGLDLACWCPPEAPCHADVLLELANQ